MKAYALAIIAAVFAVQSEAVDLQQAIDTINEVNTLLPQYLADSAAVARSLVEEGADMEDGCELPEEDCDDEEEEEVGTWSKTVNGVTQVCIPEEEEGCTLTMSVDMDKRVVEFVNVPDEILEDDSDDE